MRIEDGTNFQYIQQWTGIRTKLAVAVWLTCGLNKQILNHAPKEKGAFM
jgi:hypothetical protein